ncbi:hypothetical protein [Calothrix sp. PCC 7507]|uniref:hypothetical protein n=1 Tax=Calothrix sp. PCC 7507 TaxID=99598 RepID=UPI00029ECB35|nr:hypothetical protein [Calothrix sp. PCC 7507]AFY33425.1 hypothetical protein Cal7507_3012 [Calothrix sp. PCC 7507]
MTAQNMPKIKHLPLNCLYVGITLAVMNAAIAPVSAQSVIIINGARVNQLPAPNYSVYGSPINNLRVVHPARRQIIHRSYYHDGDIRQNVVYPRQIYPNVNYPTSNFRVVHPARRQIIHRSYYRDGGVRQNVVYPRQIYPNVNYPRIRYSTPNPVNVNNSWHDTPFRGRSRVILSPR